MRKFLTDLAQCLASGNGLRRFSLPRRKAFLGLCDPRFIQRAERLMFHLDKQSFGQPFALRRRQPPRLFLESQRSCRHGFPPSTNRLPIDNSTGLNSRCNGWVCYVPVDSHEL